RLKAVCLPTVRSRLSRIGPSGFACFSEIASLYYGPYRILLLPLPIIQQMLKVRQHFPRPTPFYQPLTTGPFIALLSAIRVAEVVHDSKDRKGIPPSQDDDSRERSAAIKASG